MKAFIPYHIVAGDIVFKPTQEVSEPKDTQWRTFGVRTPDTVFLDEAHLVHTDNDSQFVDVVVVERVLPSSSIKRAVREIAEKHFADTGEKADKRMLAQWKEEYINDSLPNAPLKETVVRVARYKGFLFIGTSSAKLADDVMVFVKGKVIDNYDPETHIIKTVDFNKMPAWLYNTLIAGGWGNVEIGASVKLYDPETGRKVSISNDDMLSQADRVLGGVNNVAEMQLVVEDNVTFSVNEKGVFKGIKLHKTEQRKEQLTESESKTVEFKTQWVFMKDAISQMIEIISNVSSKGDDDEL